MVLALALAVPVVLAALAVSVVLVALAASVVLAKCSFALAVLVLLAVVSSMRCAVGADCADCLLGVFCFVLILHLPFTVSIPTFMFNCRFTLPFQQHMFICSYVDIITRLKSVKLRFQVVIKHGET